MNNEMRRSVRARLLPGLATITITGLLALGCEGAAFAASVLASYDSTLGAPACRAPGIGCDSGALLTGRGTMSPVEANAPNTLVQSGCTDGNSGTFHGDESLDRLETASLDGKVMRQRFTARITATVWAWGDGTTDFLDLYYATDANHPAWTWLATLSPGGGGQRVLTYDFNVPSGTPLQAIRGVFRYGGSKAACNPGSYNDHDDLVFGVRAYGDFPPAAQPLGAPACQYLSIGCDASEIYLTGRGTMSPAETNAPNTLLQSSCTDGNSGVFHSDESLDGLEIASVDGDMLTEGRRARIAAYVWAYSGGGDFLDLYSAPNANSPTWTFLATIPAVGGGQQVLTHEFTLPTGLLQAIRGVFRYAGSAIGACNPGSYNDHDDLVFPVRVSPAQAIYDSTLGAPACRNFGPGCDSGNLLTGRGLMNGGSEANTPNTLLQSSCADGNTGDFHNSPSLDRLAITSVDGGDLTQGSKARIIATVWNSSSAPLTGGDQLDLWLAPDANRPTWTFLRTLTASSYARNSQYVLTWNFTLPSGTLQAIRGVYRVGGVGPTEPCLTGPSNDHDDLVFSVR